MWVVIKCFFGIHGWKTWWYWNEVGRKVEYQYCEFCCHRWFKDYESYREVTSTN